MSLCWCDLTYAMWLVRAPYLIMSVGVMWHPLSSVACRPMGPVGCHRSLVPGPRVSPLVPWRPPVPRSLVLGLVPGPGPPLFTPAGAVLVVLSKPPSCRLMLFHVSQGVCSACWVHWLIRRMSIEHPAEPWIEIAHCKL